MARILVCDDDRDIVSALCIYLGAEGHETVRAYCGKEALAALNDTPVQLVLLDIMMPGMDGIETLGKIRACSNVPVIMLTAKSEDADKVLGLNIGADDYVTKPFAPLELMARVRSQLRRYTRLGSALSEEVLRVGGVELCDPQKRVTKDGEEISLTGREYDILKLLMQQPGVVFSPQEIYRRVAGGAAVGAENTVAVHMRHLREKIEIDPANPQYLKVVWGQGYKMEVQHEK